MERLDSRSPNIKNSLDAYRLVQEYSKIISQSFRTQTIVIKMSYKLFLDTMKTMQKIVDDLQKKSDTKDWKLLGLASVFVFSILYIVFKYWIFKELGIAFPI